MQVAQLIGAPALHIVQHRVLLIAPASTLVGIDQLARKGVLDGIHHPLVSGGIGSARIVTSPWHCVVVRVFVLAVHLFRALQLVGLPSRSLAEDHQVFGLGGDALGVVAGRIGFLPDDVAHEALPAEDLVHHQAQVGALVVTNADKDGAVVGKQLPQKRQPRVHHTQPLVVA